MITLIGVEFAKIRTIRSPWLLLGISQLVIVLGVSGLFVGGADLQAAATPVTGVGHAGLMSLFTLVLGITAVAGEYRHRSITETYLGTPRRERVMLAKLAAYTGLGLLFGIANAITAIVATAAWMAGKGGSFDLSGTGVWQTLLGGIGWNAAFAAIGVGVGALVRNLTGAIAAALAWLALVEGLIAQLVGDQAKWLPFASGMALSRLPAPAATLSQAGAAVTLIGYAVVVAAAAVSTTVRRDVS